MKTIITIITFVLAVIGVTVSLTQTPWIIAVSAVIGFIAISLLLLFEYLAETKDNKFFRGICYYFTPTQDKYKVINQVVTYKYLRENEIEFTEFQNCLCLKDGFEIIKKAIYWYGDNTDYVVTANDTSTATTTTFTKRQNCKYFDYRLINGCLKHKRFDVNYTISKLKDTENNATFNRFIVRHKVKRLKLRVILPNNMQINKVNFVVQNKISAENLLNPLEMRPYDEQFNVYEKEIEFPRRHWTYSIEWAIE